MAKNFVQVGENLTLPVTEDVKSGELVQVGEIIGVALTDAKTDDGTNYYTTIATKGVWNLTLKATTTVGDVVFYSAEGWW
jgi:predicted RecA/RadA family phage recombinase